ncbi:rhomboid family intramembrane serine protease [Candidatus Obscuribacterales bacterium]|nr:rhomboid family intramembrane serine protease [Candidatus Obscuribacterales bacterium]
MLPLRDDNTDSKSEPWVNYILIAANVFVFVFFQGLGTNEAFTNSFSTIPREILTGQDVIGSVPISDGNGNSTTLQLGQTPVSVYLTLFTSMFMHGGFAHISGNMLYLWIFGDNLEDRMGHLKYLLFYLICGTIAGLSHVVCTGASGTNALIPSLGASGAISGVLGGYILLFPHRRVTVLFLRQIMDVPAYVCLGLWIVFQAAESSGILGGSPDGAGVAYAAHLGGFIAGLCLVKIFAGRSESQSWRSR